MYEILVKLQETGNLDKDEAAYREKELNSLRIKEHSDFIVHKDRPPLGKGGSGEVYAGTYCSIEVAVKCIMCMKGDGDLKKAENEILLHNSSKHPQVVRIYGTDLNQLFYKAYATFNNNIIDGDISTADILITIIYLF